MAAGVYVIDTRKFGPVFDGRAEALAEVALQRTVDSLARQGTAIIKAKADKMNRSGRATGHAPGTIVMAIAPTSAVIFGASARGEIWWPWLEGTSSRNKSTRFKGYHAFRLARNVINRRAVSVAEAKLAEVIGEMGGSAA